MPNQFEIFSTHTPHEINFEQRGTGNTFTLRSVGTNTIFNQADHERIAKVCNEPEIYNRLIIYRLNGQPYTIEHAKNFVNLGMQRERDGQGFLFFIRDFNGEISGVIDINSRPPISRIGYWNSSENPGVMSRALSALCILAPKLGYDELFATPAPDNIKSQKALLRAGFIKGEEVPAWDGNMWPKYYKKIQKLTHPS